MKEAPEIVELYRGQVHVQLKIFYEGNYFTV